MKRVPSLSFFGGLTTIGGVHVVLSDGDTALLFDLGVYPHGLFDDIIQPSRDGALRQYLLTKMAPPLLDIYDPTHLGSLTETQLRPLWGDLNLPAYNEIVGYFSHMHQDHSALLPYLRQDFDAYCSSNTHAIQAGAAAAGEVLPPGCRLHGLEHGSTTELGSLRFTLWEMDHGIPGAAGFIVEAGNYTVAFTGDWRWNGAHQDRILQFAELCKSRNVDVLITEATTAGPDDRPRRAVKVVESEVLPAFEQVLRQADGLVYMSLPARNIERMAGMIAATAASGRTAVLDPATAAIWHRAVVAKAPVLQGHKACSMPEKVAVLATEQDTAGLPYQTVTLDEIGYHRQQYVLFRRYQELAPLIELERFYGKTTQSHFFLADGRPAHGDEPEFQRWMTDLGIKVHTWSSGGHVVPEDLQRFIDMVEPKVLIPLHSRYPSTVRGRCGHRFLPRRGETVTVAELLRRAQVPGSDE